MAQQTAVEWLYDELKKYIAVEWPVNQSVRRMVEEAKVMEKEQIIKAASIVLWNNSSNSREEAEQYYNETYNK